MSNGNNAVDTNDVEDFDLGAYLVALEAECDYMEDSFDE